MHRVTKETAVKAWLRRAWADFFMAFEHSPLIYYELFWLHQGIEKSCKAFVIASKHATYEHLSDRDATQKIHTIAKSLRHDLVILLNRVSNDVTDLKAWMNDKDFLGLLNVMYEEARYPMPMATSAWKRYGFPAMASDRNYRKAFTIGLTILNAFPACHGIDFSLQQPVNGSIDSEAWGRFRNILKENRVQ